MKAIFRAALLLMALGGASEAMARTCGEFHVVRAGDTLRSITVDTYAHTRFQVLFRANRDILTDPGQIEIGQLLYLPCPRRGPRTREAALTAAGRIPTTAENVGVREARRAGFRQQALSQPAVARTPRFRAPVEEVPAPLLLTLPHLGPYVSEERPGKGLLAELINAALTTGDTPQSGEVRFVDDAPAHLRVLLPMGSFGASFPWARPDCLEERDLLARQLCDDYLFSRPLYEGTLALYQRNGVGGIARHVCVPRVIQPYDAQALGLDGLELRSGITTNDCFARLLDGEVDLVVADTLAAASVERSGRAEALPRRSHSRTLHAVFRRGDAKAEDLLRRLDDGIAALQASGAWFEIVVRHLSAHGSKIARR